MFLQNLRLELLDPTGPIGAGAEDELFRDVGRRAAVEVLSRRWESAAARADLLMSSVWHAVAEHGPAKQGISNSLRSNTAKATSRLLQSLSCNHCDAGRATGRQGNGDHTRPTEGDLPCSSREIERIANRHGREMDKL
jgi:hypothetical protein